MNQQNILHLTGNTHENFDILFPVIRKYGDHCMAYSTLQENLHYTVMPERGYAAWIDCKIIPGISPHKVILSNPVAEPDVQEEIIHRMTSNGERITLVMINKDLADRLYRRNFKIYGLGIETVIDIPEYDLKGKSKAQLRQWCNKSRREGTVVVEQELSQIPADVRQGICNEWLKEKGGSELSFLTRPIPDHEEKDVRFFWAYKDGEIIGLTGFDPMYRDGEVIGYYHNFDRLKDIAPNGTSAFLLLSALEIFKAEGMEKMSLGLSPLQNLKSEYNMKGFLKFLAEMISKYGESLYPFRGNMQHKSKYRGTPEPVYVASNGMWIETMLAAGTACGLSLS